ncbi:MAG: hypothetical protein JXR25_10850 [Pontiellaceae bacterium]|nr:hypothetical protein [Pontiellaceae bacterium]
MKIVITGYVGEEHACWSFAEYRTGYRQVVSLPIPLSSLDCSGLGGRSWGDYLFIVLMIFGIFNPFVPFPPFFQVYIAYVFS